MRCQKREKQVDLFCRLSLAGVLLVMQPAVEAELPLLPEIGAVDRRSQSIRGNRRGMRSPRCGPISARAARAR
jgi:hypothetical protein